MKPQTKLLFYFVFVILFANCSKIENPNINDGLNFYLTKNNLVDNFTTTDYNTINIDTIELYNEPFISYNNIAYYDTSMFNEVILGLKSNKNNIEFAGNKRMFVAKIDDKPIYFGFLWSILISKGSNWIFIEDPQEQNGIGTNELRILTNTKCDNQVINPELLNRLMIDNKLK